MGRIILLLGIMLINLLPPVFGEKNKYRNIGFNFFKRGVDDVEMVGNFGKEGKMVYLPMLKISDKQWTLSLSLIPGFYYYRYRIEKEHWRLDSFIKEMVVVQDGPVQGKCTLLKIFPIDYESYIKLSEDYIIEKKLKWAKDVLLKGAREYPDKIDIYDKLGNVYEMMGYYGFAVDAYTAALEKDADQYEIRYKLAKSYDRLFENEKKKIYMEKARLHWVELLEAGKYKSEARESLVNK